MKKTTITVVVLAIVIILAIVLFGSKSTTNTSNVANNTETSTQSVPVSETVKVSGKLTEYKNSELGFAVQYPSSWSKGESASGVNFVVPIDKDTVTTMAKLEVDISTFSGKCAFPPVTTVKERKTVTLGDKSFSMITLANTVQNRSYFNRMYSYQRDNVCYIFAFSSISFAPASKGLSGSNVVQAENNNKALINTTDQAFTEMVKSFQFVKTEDGKDEGSVGTKK